MALTITKVIISILVVVILTEVSKRVNPTLGGILSGVPLGAGLSVYFISYSEGIEFMVQGIPWGIGGLVSAIAFCFFYLLGGKLTYDKNKIFSIAFSSILGFTVFFAIGYVIRGINLGLSLASVIFIVAFIVNISVIGKVRIDSGRTVDRKPSNQFISMVFRGTVVGIIIVTITGAASVIGSQWAGILSSFPSTLYALILVLHYEEGNALYPPVIRGFSYGVSTLAVFYILCWYLLPGLGLNLGFIVVYVLSVVYLYFFNRIKNLLVIK